MYVTSEEDDIDEIECGNEIIRHTWTIDNFSKQLEELPTGSFISSELLHEKHGCEFTIKAYLNGFNENYKNSISLFLNYNHGQIPKIEIEFTCYILNAELEKKFPKKRSNIFLRNANCGFYNFVSHSRLIYCKLPDDKLTIVSELKIFNKFIYPHYMFEQKFEQFFGQSKYSDFSLQVGDKNFKVNKIILAAQSPVFEAMFENNMMEKQKNSVTIEDLDIDVIKGMLEFMYTAQCHNLDEIAPGLLIAADKYQIQNLKTICEDKLSETISIENAINILLLADTHNAPELKSAVLSYVKYHIKDIMELQTWKATEIPGDLLKDIISLLFKMIEK